jgi:predicted dehydrogenase
MNWRYFDGMEGERRVHKKIGVGIYGMNGHQVQGQLAENAWGACVASAAVDAKTLSGMTLSGMVPVRDYTSLGDLLKDPRVELVSLCSPRRCEQAEDALSCMRAGKHVYAEKPCALSERDLDRILEMAARTGCMFHEMAGTAFEQPYRKMREVVQDGTIGTVVQVLAQKSYPYHDRRPQNEAVDGGLLMQVGVHALRMVEHVAGVRVEEMEVMETQLGNPGVGSLRMACGLLLRLENGGLASVIANYLNMSGVRRWGNETLRIFGTLGFVEAVDGGTCTRLVVGDKDQGALDVAQPGWDYLDLYLALLLGQGNMPLTLEEELHPTRMVIRAKERAGF